MAETSPTRRLTAGHLWALRRLGYRLDYTIPTSGGWKLYALRQPGHKLIVNRDAPRLSLSAPPKQHAQAVTR